MVVKVRRGELCDRVCLIIGITRKRKLRPELSRRELERLVSYLSIKETPEVLEPKP